MRIERPCGMFQSNLEGIQDAANILKVTQIPEEYDLSAQTRQVINQGNCGCCVSAALTDILEWKGKQAGKPIDIPMKYFYDNRADKKLDGMTPREAIEMAAKDWGVMVYAKIQDINTLKKSIFASGPCMICLPVRADNYDFWKGPELIGGHALVATGWEADGIIIKNSWGWAYGNNGYWILPNCDFRYLYEAWTIIV